MISKLLDFLIIEASYQGVLAIVGALFCFCNCFLSKRIIPILITTGSSLREFKHAHPRASSSLFCVWDETNFVLGDVPFALSHFLFVIVRGIYRFLVSMTENSGFYRPILTESPEQICSRKMVEKFLDSRYHTCWSERLRSIWPRSFVLLTVILSLLVGASAHTPIVPTNGKSVIEFPFYQLGTVLDIIAAKLLENHFKSFCLQWINCKLMFLH